VQANGALELGRTWALGGEGSVRPFLTVLAGGAVRVGCGVDGSRLAWVDPDGGGRPLWGAKTTEGPSVGTPRRAGRPVVGADGSGQFVALDPATGKSPGPGYRVGGSVVPVASPVPFIDGRLLAPLSDGTLLLLAEDRVNRAEGRAQAGR